MLSYIAPGTSCRILPLLPHIIYTVVFIVPVVVGAILLLVALWKMMRAQEKIADALTLIARQGKDTNVSATPPSDNPDR